MSRYLFIIAFCFFPFLVSGGEPGLMDPGVGLLGADAQFAKEFPIFTIILRAYYYLATLTGLPGFCWVCPFFVRFYHIMAAASYYIATTLEMWVIKLIVVGILFAIALKVLQLYMALKELTPKDAFKELLPFLGKAIIVLILVANLSFFVSVLLNPFINLFIGIGQQLQAKQLDNMTDSYFVVNAAFSQCSAAQCTYTGATFSFIPQMFMQAKLCEAVLKIICWMNGVMVVGIAIGMTFMVCAVRHTVNGNGFDLSALLLGLVLCIYYVILMIQYPFRFFEAILRLGFVFALLPFLLACWLFKATQEYFKRGWSMFLNATVSLFFLILISLWIIELVNFSFGGTDGQKNLIKLLLEKKDTEALALFRSETTGFLTTFLVLQTAVALLNVVDKLTGFLTDTNVPELASRNAEGRMVGYGQQISNAIKSIPTGGK